MSLFEKLNDIQCNLIANKGQYNSFGKYKYRSCEDILESCKPHLKRLKADITLSDEMIEVAGRVYVKATATFIDTETGEKLITTANAREALEKKGMDESQVTGSASSYARKYALNGLLAIDDVKDADTRDNSFEEQKELAGLKEDKVTKADIAIIKRELERTGVMESTLLTMCNITKLQDMSKEQYGKMLHKFKNTKGQK